MLESLFINYVKKYFKPLVAKITEKINDKKQEVTLRYKQMLTPEYSADLKWGSKEISTSIVSADIVAMDSALPLKKRDKFSEASGDIPKLGMKLRKTEKDISDINVMKARGASEQTIVEKLFNDITKCLKGIEHANEIMFLQGLSTGVCMIPNADSGKGVRLDYGYLDENKFKASIAWGNTGFKPLTDMEAVFEKANSDGNSIMYVMLSRSYLNLIRSSDEGKQLVATFNGTMVTDSSVLPTPTRSNLLDALADEFGATFEEVNASFKVEKNDGTREAIKPFKEENIVFLPDRNVGRLVWGDVAEKTNKVAGVMYEESSNGILLSKYSKNDPLEEYTSSQALNVPVLDSVDSIYLLEADQKA